MAASPPSTAALSVSTIHPLLPTSPTSPRISAWLTSLLPSPSTAAHIQPTIKSYPEAQYHTYLPLGLDLIYSPPPANSSDWELDRIDIYNPVPGVAPPVAGSSRRRPPPVYTPPKLPLVIQLARAPINPPPPTAPPSTSPSNPNQPDPPTSTSEVPEPRVEATGRPEPFHITSEATGREFVSALGEPSRKGGAQGWVGPWLEWSDLRVLAEKSHSGDQEEEVEEEEVSIGLMVELRQTYREPTEEEMKKGLGGVWDQAASWGWGCVKIFRVGSTL